MDTEQQLMCSICSEEFSVPVTISCGHTFCKGCLIQATKQKLVCPLCRCLFMRSAQYLKQNIIISNLVRKKRSNQQQKNFKSKQQEQKQFREVRSQQNSNLHQQKQIINCILLVFTTQDLILPYSKKNISFTLPHNSIIEQLKNVVILQDLQYGKNIVYGKVTLVNTQENTFGSFDGIFQALSFFQIKQTKMIEAESPEQQKFMVNICSGYQIQKKSKLQIKEFDHFFSIFDRIQQPYLIRQIYNQIDYRVFTEKNNSQALILCILSLLRIDDRTKFKILHFQFEDDQINYIDSFLRKFEIEGLIRNPQVAFNINLPGNFNGKIILFLTIFLIVGYYCGIVY